MRKIMISGLALGNAYDSCSACNYDFNWLINYPSLLLWVDELLISKHIWQVIQETRYPKNKKVAKAIKLMFDMANAEGIVKIFDPTEIMTKDHSDNIFYQIDEDKKLLERAFNDTYSSGSEGVPDAFKLGQTEYCSPVLWTYYASNYLAEHFSAHCILPGQAYKYFNHLFGADLKMINHAATVSSFDKVFEVAIPNELTVHNYAFVGDDHCNSCMKEEECKDTYLLGLEKDVDKFLTFRTYDEIQSIKEVTEKIIKIRNENNGHLDPLEVKEEFIVRKKQIERGMHKSFPRVERWSNLATVLSVPVAVGGLYLQNPEMTVAGASVAGVATIAKESISYMRNKYNWIGFVNSFKK